MITNRSRLGDIWDQYPIFPLKYHVYLPIFGQTLDKALIKSANKSALDLFGRDVQPETFGKLRSGLQNQSVGDSRWLYELFCVVKKAAAGLKFYSIQGVLQSYEGKIYRPVLCAVERTMLTNKIETYKVTFAEEVRYVDEAVIPRHVSELATLLRFAFRFKWEVLMKFGNKELTEDDVVRVGNAIGRIGKEWKSRGLVTDDALYMRIFQKEKARRIIAMVQYWRTMQNDEGTGELDVAIKNKDASKVSAILKEVVPLSQEFVEIVAERFAEQVAEK